MGKGNRPNTHLKTESDLLVLIPKDTTEQKTQFGKQRPIGHVEKYLAGNVFEYINHKGHTETQWDTVKGLATLHTVQVQTTHMIKQQIYNHQL